MIRRLLASYLVIITFVLVALGVPVWRSTVQAERETLRTNLERDAVVMATLVEDVLSDIDNRGTADERATVSAVAKSYSERTGARVVVVDKTGRTLADNESPNERARSFASRPEIAAALAGRVGVDERYSHTLGRSALFVAIPVSSAGQLLGAVRLSYTTAQMDRRVRVRTWRLAWAAMFAVLAASVLAAAMARSLTRPVLALREAAKAFGDGNLGARVPTGNAPSELRALAADFNSMAARIEDLVEAQNSFVSDASHQLRSPLTAARLRVEALAYAPAAEVADGVDAAVDELSRLSRIIDGLLELASAGLASDPAQMVDVVPTLADRVETWSALAQERGIDLALVASGGVRARVAPDRLSQILDNLICNALDASDAGSSLRAAVSVDETAVAITFTDQGRGMTDEQRSRAFDRMWRANGRRTDLSGSGLGLPIARMLARADGGELTLRPGPGGVGTTALLRYPFAGTSPRTSDSAAIGKG